jgi:hypothetical protein
MFKQGSHVARLVEVMKAGGISTRKRVQISRTIGIQSTSGRQAAAIGITSR